MLSVPGSLEKCASNLYIITSYHTKTQYENVICRTYIISGFIFQFICKWNAFRLLSTSAYEAHGAYNIKIIRYMPLNMQRFYMYFGLILQVSPQRSSTVLDLPPKERECAALENIRVESSMIEETMRPFLLFLLASASQIWMKQLNTTTVSG